jgi:hypothetical protein
VRPPALNLKGTISGRVVDTHGTPVPDAIVETRVLPSSLMRPGMA